FVMLLLRTLIILLIILAFARPAIRSVFKEDGRTSAIIIIDGTASMLYVDNGELLFNKALRKAEEIINFLKKDDTAAIIFSGNNPTFPVPELTGDKNRLLKVLKNSENSWSRGNPIRSFNMAFDLLNSSGALNKEIYYLTDGASNAFPDSINNTNESIRLYTILLGPEKREGSVIEDINLVDKLLAPGKKTTFRVSALAGSEGNEMDIEFFVNGERKGKASVIKRSGNIVGTDFSYIPENEGWYSIYATIRDGYFETGEKRRITIHVPHIV
ncbi:unnamed protein product, partial [marine sediment metagenome]